MGCWSLVVEDEQEPSKEEGEGNNAYKDRLNKYKSHYCGTNFFFLETVDLQWLPLITANEMPSRIWKVL